MEASPLNDPQVYPDDDVLVVHLGAAWAAWDEFVTGAAEVVEGAELGWRYYRDGRSWLCKVSRGDRTICWVSAWDGFFRATFYFTEKADAGIEQLAIDPALREGYASATRSGSLKPLTIEVRQREQLADLFALARFKAGAAGRSRPGGPGRLTTTGRSPPC